MRKTNGETYREYLEGMLRPELSRVAKDYWGVDSESLTNSEIIDRCVEGFEYLFEMAADPNIT